MTGHFSLLPMWSCYRISPFIRLLLDAELLYCEQFRIDNGILHDCIEVMFKIFIKVTQWSGPCDHLSTCFVNMEKNGVIRSIFFHIISHCQSDCSTLQSFVKSGDLSLIPSFSVSHFCFNFDDFSPNQGMIRNVILWWSFSVFCISVMPCYLKTTNQSTHLLTRYHVQFIHRSLPSG